MVELMRVDNAIARIIGAARPDAPTWQAEAANALTVAALAGEAAPDRDALMRLLHNDLATIRLRYTAAKAGNAEARDAILDASDNVHAALDKHMGPTWTPDFGSLGAKLMGIAAQRT